jgi:hypothetical protein
MQFDHPVAKLRHGRAVLWRDLLDDYPGRFGGLVSEPPAKYLTCVVQRGHFVGYLRQASPIVLPTRRWSITD